MRPRIQVGGCYPYNIKVLPLQHDRRKSLRDNVPKVYNRETGKLFPVAYETKAARRDQFPSLASCSSGSVRAGKAGVSWIEVLPLTT